MLQFVVKTNEKYTIAELSQMVIEGGCKWLVLDVPEMADEEIRELSQELIPLCKETGTILTIIDHIELAKDLGIHGVLLTGNDISALKVREDFGPEAIIGVQVSMASSALALANADIDYVAFPANMPLDKVAENIKLLKQSSFPLPIVAQGSFSVDEIAEVMGTGISGIAESEPILSALDPVEETKRIIQAMESFANKGI